MDEVVQKAIDRLHETFDRTDLEVEGRKIQRKLDEARFNPGDVTPLADCVLSVLLAAKSQGFSVRAVMAEVARVAGEIMEKRWKKMPDGTYQSV